MKLLSARVLVPVAVLVIAWGGAHLLGTRSLGVTPATWPSATAEPGMTSPGAGPVPPGLSGPTPAPSASAGGSGGVPLLPGALQQLNGNTRDTAVGLYALLTQLEAALRDDLRQLVQRLEPGR